MHLARAILRLGNLFNWFLLLHLRDKLHRHVRVTLRHLLVTFVTLNAEPREILSPPSPTLNLWLVVVSNAEQCLSSFPTKLPAPLRMQPVPRCLVSPRTHRAQSAPVILL